MSFPDGGKAESSPGMTALIEGGSFYQLTNTSDGPMVLLGTRTGPNSANTHINYETGEDFLKDGNFREAGVGLIMPASQSVRNK